MLYRWNGENKLCIPGLPKISPGAVFEMEEVHLANAGVQELMKAGLITVVEGAASGTVPDLPDEPSAPESQTGITEKAKDVIEDLADDGRLNRSNRKKK